jgi:glycosyltransferase involved in cell wall biosynthesis
MEQRVRPLLKQGRTVACIGWGVDLSRFKGELGVGQLRRQWGLRGDQPILFSPRLMQRRYRLERIIQAMPTILKRVPEAVLVMAEHCPDVAYVEELKHVAARLKLCAQVRFVGSLSYEQMPLWYNLADATVMVPESDGMPNSLLEAMACGSVPVLAKLPQYRELVESGVNGFVVDPEASAIGQAVIKAMTEPVLRREIAHRNRAIVEMHADQNKEMTRMESWYERLAGRVRGRAESCAA